MKLTEMYVDFDEQIKVMERSELLTVIDDLHFLLIGAQNRLHKLEGTSPLWQCLRMSNDVFQTSVQVAHPAIPGLSIRLASRFKKESEVKNG